ncbi:hypothetical protein, partial [Klebsiella pneumoniae]|uniref:hypothetical protein n=1 Tax=Klebsiella pneumoniae TaxID=573 RepID=UPI00210C5237
GAFGEAVGRRTAQLRLTALVMLGIKDQETYMNAPQHRKEGVTKRTNFSLNGPLSDSVSFNLWGNLSKTQADAQDINAGHEAERTGSLDTGNQF